MPALLADFVRSKFGAAMTREEAGQVMFAIFCSVDWLPGDLKKKEWSRSTLSFEFVALAKEGLLRDSDTTDEDVAHWCRVIDQFMSKQIEVDWQFRKRIHSQ